MTEAKMKKELETILDEVGLIEPFIARLKIKATGLRNSLESFHSSASPKGAKNKKAHQFIATQAVIKRRQQLSK